MTFGSTDRAAKRQAWSPRPGRAVLVRVGVLAAPILASFAVTRFARAAFWHPEGWPGLAVFIVQAAVVGSAVALLTERAVRRVLPLAALLNLTLVFPDRAPARFGMALRSRSLKKLQQSLDEGLPPDHQAAAERAVEMVTALGHHERLTRGHTERVRAYSDMIGEQLGLSDTDRQWLSWAAVTHDIGKLVVPAEILTLPTQPNAEQWAIIRQHPAAGEELLEPLAGWLGDWRLAAAQHHERWDGGGYPYGIQGTDIGLAGRIVAVADAFDVITSHRSYKNPVSPTVARAEIVRSSGTHFDPDVVRALLEVSLGRERRGFGFLGWFTELGGFAAVPRGLAQAAAVATTAAAVTVAAVAGAPMPGSEMVEATLGDLATDPPGELTFDDPVVTPEGEPRPAEPSSGSTTSTPSPDEDTSEPRSDGEDLKPAATATSTTTQGEVTTGSTASATTTTAAPATTSTSTSTTTTSTTTTTSSTTTTPPPAADWNMGSGGHTTSQNFLPLDGTLASGALPNYDTDRDAEPGLLVAKGDGLSETDTTKIQHWSLAMNNDRIVGTPTLDLWAAIKDFDTDKTGRVVAGIYDCNSGHGGCSLLANGAASFDQGDFGSTDYGQVTVTMGAVDHTFAASRTLVVKVASSNSSDDDLWFAYGTTTYPTRFGVS